MFCTKCGAAMHPGDRFCPSCGNETEQSQNAQNSQNNGFNPNNQYGNQYTQYGQNGYNGFNQPYYTPAQKPKNNTCAIVGFIISCASLLINLAGLVGIGGLVVSIVGYNQIKTSGESGNGFAIAGIIIGAFSAFFGLLLILLLPSIVSELLLI